ncbi:hypothetical protein PEBR_20604 [Penicillium brasilianum]|uniref:Uncharacterized protein n=1 Tax=Penicillium brasilianum TaxID=104259 RepID=A0A1S9RM86_PENBI|nr:hypothetical protein PEBR_20604 [Penicillium brasilianum]
MATAATTRRSGPDGKIDAARKDSLWSKDKRYLWLKGREAKLEAEQTLFQQAKQKFLQEKREFEERKEKHEQEELCFKLKCKSTREQWTMDTLDLKREATRNEEFRRRLETKRDDIVRPYLWAEADKREALQSRIICLEKDLGVAKNELKKAQNRNSDYCRQLTEHRRTIAHDVAKEVEQELHRQEGELVRKATEARKSATRKFRDANGQLRKARSMNSKLSEIVRTANKRYDELKDESNKYRQEQAQASQRLRWATRLDADNDSLVQGGNDDPEASHVAALREIDRLHAVHQADTRRHNYEKTNLRNQSTLRYKKVRVQACKIYSLERDLAKKAATDNLSNLPLTEKKDAAVQTEAAVQTDAAIQTDAAVQIEADVLTDSYAQSGAPVQAEASVQSDGAQSSMAEGFHAAQSMHQELFETITSLQEQVQQLEVDKALEQARSYNLDWNYRECQKLLEAIPSLQEQLKQLEEAKALEQARADSLEEEHAKKATELEVILKKYLNVLDHIRGLDGPTGALRDTVLTADEALDEIKKAYENPLTNIQLTTLLGDESRLAGELGQLFHWSDIIVDGIEKTDDGIIFKDEAELVRQYLSPQS